MKRVSIFAGIVIALIMLFNLLPTMRAQAFAATATPTAAAVNVPAVCDTTRSVQVSGTSLINVVPDRALIQLGVQSNGSSPADVEQDNSTAINKIMRVLKNLGIDAKDISSDLYYVEPVYSSYDSLSIKGYRINNTVAVTLRDISKVNTVISTALESGANQIINVELYTSDLRKYRDQARGLAVKAASEKADLLATSAGAQRGCVLSITENVYSYYNGWWMGQSNNIWAQNVTQNAAPGNNVPSPEEGAVSLGQIAVRAEVTVTYSLK
jgi:uncharacterized protein YggE